MTTTQKNDKNPRVINKEKLFILSVLLMIFFYISLGETPFYIKFFVIFFVWSLFYFIWCLVFKFFNIKWFFKSKTWLFYSLFFIVSIIYLFSNIKLSTLFSKLQNLWNNNIFSEKDWNNDFQYDRDFITWQVSSWNESSDLTKALWTLQKSLENDKLDTKLLNESDLHFMQNKMLTYKDLIPFLVKKYYLSSDNYADIELWRGISKDDEDYKYFKTAYYFHMFDIEIKDINEYARCKDLMFFVWQAQRRNLQYTSVNGYDVFWTEAAKQWLLAKWCNQQNKNVVWKDIP